MTLMKTISIRKSAVSIFALSAFLFSMSALGFNPPSDPEPDPDPTPCETGCDFTRGPNPTESYLEASSGPYSVRTIDVSRYVSGFGGGTIHYPIGTTGEMGAIAIVPGFLAGESSIQWWGPRLASHGFVVITISTNSVFDQPDSRSAQLGSALDYVIARSNSTTSAIFGMVDGARVGAMGWSMGGGGTLRRGRSGTGRPRVGAGGTGGVGGIGGAGNTGNPSVLAAVTKSADTQP